MPIVAAASRSSLPEICDAYTLAQTGAAFNKSCGDADAAGFEKARRQYFDIINAE